MKHRPNARAIALRNQLVNTRQMTSLLDRELALATNEVKRETINWVPMWVDWGHAIRSDCNTATALRAITDRSELLWYVRHDTKKHGYHSLHSDPFEAIHEALGAWQKRKLVRAEWQQVHHLSRDLIVGRKRLTVTREDAEDSALCTLGIKWFADRFKLSRKRSISGRTAALLMKVEPQLGFVIHQAALRENLLGPIREPYTTHPQITGEPT